MNSPALAPGDKQRIKEALIAKASKYFSYGYGPVAGSKIIIEEVGEVDEDEEEYGEYQEERVDGVEGKHDIWTWGDGNTFAVEEVGEGVEDDEVLSNNEVVQARYNDVEEDNLPEWARGAKGKSKFDEYYDARIAKHTRPERPKRAPSPWILSLPARSKFKRGRWLIGHTSIYNQLEKLLGIQFNRTTYKHTRP